MDGALFLELAFCIQVAAGSCAEGFTRHDDYCFYNLWYFWLAIVSVLFFVIFGVCLYLKKRGRGRSAIQAAPAASGVHRHHVMPATPVKPPPYGAPSHEPPPYTVSRRPGPQPHPNTYTSGYLGPSVPPAPAGPAYAAYPLMPYEAAYPPPATRPISAYRSPPPYSDVTVHPGGPSGPSAMPNID